MSDSRELRDRALFVRPANGGDRAHDFSAEARELATDMESRFGEEKVDGNTARSALKDFLASARTAIGSLAPEIRGTDADGVEFGLSEYRGKVVVLDFLGRLVPALPRHVRSRTRDGGTPPGSTLRAFGDSAWRLDPTPIGFGPVPCRSSFDLGLPGARPVSTLLRTTFDAPADGIPSSLLMRVRHVDGIVVSLNGKEVFRDQLPAASDQLTPATNLVPVSGQTSGTFVTLDGGLLLPTGNCLAVELHAASSYRAVALFDLEIGPLPDFDALAADAPESRKLEVAAMVCNIGLENANALPLLEKWSTGSSPELQLQAATALGMNDRAIRLPGLANPDIVRAYLATGLGASKQALEVVKRDDLSPDQYTRALGLATVGCRMRDVAPEQIRSRFDEAESVRSMALYRCGRLEEAKASLEKSQSIRGDNPIDMAILALIERKIGDAATAGDLRDRCLTMGHDDEWRHSAGLASLLRELSRAFDGPME